MKNKVLNLLRLSLPCALLMTSMSATAFKPLSVQSPKNHQTITRAALIDGAPVQLTNGKQIRFTESAANTVASHNALSDSPTTHFFDSDYHFDDESFDQSSKHLDDWRNQIVSLSKAGKYEDARELLGTSLHLVQDFYAHSNWVERSLADPSLPLPELGKRGSQKLTPTTLATCNYTGLIPGAAFTTGYFNILMMTAVNDVGWSTSNWNPFNSLAGPVFFRWPNDKCVHGGDTGSGLNKDQSGRNQPGRPLFDLAYLSAINGSRMFVNYVLADLDDQAICGLLDQASSLECQKSAASFFDDFNDTSLQSAYWTPRVFQNAQTTVSGGFANFSCYATASTEGKYTISGNQVVIEGRFIGTGHPYGVNGPILRDTTIYLHDVVSGGEIGMGDTNYQNGGLYAIGTGIFNLTQSGNGNSVSVYKEYRLTLNGTSLTLQRGDTLNNITETITRTLATSIAGKTFYLRIGSGGPDYCPSTFDWIRVTAN